MVEPLDPLRRAWNALDPPPIARAEPRDAATRATLAWLRAAWAVEACPPVRVTRTERFPWAVLMPATAAALLAALLLPPRPPAEPRLPVDRVVATVEPEPVEPVQIVTSSPERLELRSGAVTLVLLNPPDDD